MMDQTLEWLAVGMTGLVALAALLMFVDDLIPAIKWSLRRRSGRSRAQQSLRMVRLGAVLPALGLTSRALTQHISTDVVMLATARCSLCDLHDRCDGACHAGRGESILAYCPNRSMLQRVRSLEGVLPVAA